MLRRLPTYLVLTPFAIVLAFPFYWMLVTMFKEDLDLYNADNVPYVYNPLQWTFWESATTKHVTFIFEETNYPTWLLNTFLVGAAVVAITLVFALPAGYALARLAGRWGQSAGIGIFLVYLVPRPFSSSRCRGSSSSSGGSRGSTTTAASRTRSGR